MDCGVTGAMREGLAVLVSEDVAYARLVEGPYRAIGFFIDGGESDSHRVAEGTFEVLDCDAGLDDSADVEES